MKKQIVTVIVEDATVVDVVQLEQTIVSRVKVGTSNDPVQIPVGWSSSENVVIQDNPSIDLLLKTSVDKVVLGNTVLLGDTQRYLYNDSSFVTNIIDSDYVNAILASNNVEESDDSAISDEVRFGRFNPLVWDSGGAQYGGADYRIIAGYQPDPEFPDEVVSVRDAEFLPYGTEGFNKFRLLLATFTPTIGTGAPQTINLNWDVLASGFSISISNPLDFVSRYVDEVVDLETSSTGQFPMSIGNIIKSENFNTTGPSPIPFGGSTWSQAWTTDADWYLNTLPNRGDEAYVTDFYSLRDVVNINGSEEITGGATNQTKGGSASLWVRLKDTTGFEYGGFVEPYDNGARINFNWRNATLNVSINNVSGSNFLKTYTSTTYTTSITNLTDINNAEGALASGDPDAPAHIPKYQPAFVTALGNLDAGYTGPFTSTEDKNRWPDAWSYGGNPTQRALGSGTWTLWPPVHKDDHPQISSGPSVNYRHLYAAARITRPLGIAGSFDGDSAGGLDPAKGASYIERIYSTNNSFNASWVYYSFWLFTSSLASPPTNSDVVSGSDYKSPDVTQLGNQINNLSGFINNPGAGPQAFWFGIRASATQPNFFRTGSSASLLSDVTQTNSTVFLQPSPTPANYLAEEYSLYGFVLQPGSTYVSIGRQ